MIIVNRIQAWRKKRALRYIRESFSMFGFDLSMMSDEDLERGLANAQRAISKAGFTTDEAIKAFQKLHINMEG